ncbi:PEP-CTERM sorting domain-containing protein [Pseudorhodoferax sp. Leaf265]|uniref:PEP-CTERM sorting domain-containing protein n=1 Tax=Pseudorhodoferax sp. Leaf265 TaxID=1736315 RepID=UPI0009E7AB1F|nr:PEP-CTERM sorting domain-containing protein [Pseudorhodoferax sp. Leaf265]
MSKSTLRLQLSKIALLCAGVALSSAAAATTVTLNPLITGAAPTGSVAGGLAGTWYKVQNDARFSNQVYTDETGTTQAIGAYSWGTGIWSTGDIPGIVSGSNPYVTKTATSTGQVSYANNIYNNTQASGAYGVWGEDYQRALAPIVGGANGCPLQTEAQSLAHCGGEFNYAAVFSGYLYVGAAGVYDFGVFADDGFTFTLTGLNASLGMAHETLAGSSGRGLYELLAMNGIDELYLEQGYYGIDMTYFNRLEAGVIDLGWRGPGATAWTSIDEGNLYNQVPEPTSVALFSAALLGLWGIRRRGLSAARSAA